MSSQRTHFAAPGAPTFPPAILNLLIANGIFFLLQLMFPGPANQVGMLELWGRLYPIGSGFFYPWQLVTYGFLHSTHTFSHILFNMLALWMFGRELEYEWGAKRFLIYYLACIVGAGATHLTYMEASGIPYPVLGASGGTFGILLAFGMRFPTREILLLIPPIPMKARTFVVLYGVMELFLGFSGLGPGVAHFAHLGGLLTGLIILLYWRGKLPLKPKRPMIW